MIKSYGGHVGGVNMYCFYIPRVAKDTTEGQVLLSIPWEFELLGLRVYRGSSKPPEVPLATELEARDSEEGVRRETMTSEEQVRAAREEQVRVLREERERAVREDADRPMLSYNLLVDDIPVLVKPVEVLEMEFSDADVLPNRVIPADGRVSVVPIISGTDTAFNDITLMLCLCRK